ncbi:MFS transporter [Changpingibacter yushuensis]|uniref:MFS transporter n=1 Tax=Changpingibacter yushuensis TaxID=2758440 RepID=UPI0015F6454C|nr:glycoside-pentoside-hexuronide (GPH):cation symporter [Changpingibacter yushuensis]
MTAITEEHTKQNEDVQFSIPQRIGYAAGDFANNMSWALVSGYLMYFLTDVALLNATAVGFMLMVPKLFDAVVDPFIGDLADRTETRWGRYRPYILFACIPMLILNILTFSTFLSWSEGGRFAWASVTYVLLVVAYSLVNIPYSAMPAVLTRNTEARSSLSSYRMTAAFLSATLLAFFLLRIVDWVGGGDAAAGYQRAAIIFSLLALPFYIWCFAANKEVVKIPHVKVSYRNLFGTLVGNGPVWTLAGAFFCWGILLGATSMRLYYFRYNADNELLFANNTTIQSALSMVGAISITWLVFKVRNKSTLPQIGFVVAGLASIACFFIPIQTDTGVVLYYAMSVLFGIGQGMILASLFGMVPDTTEYTIWRYRILAAGFVSAFITFAMKVGTAISTAGAGWVLGWIGYVPNEQQNDTTLFWINFFCHVFIGSLCLVGAICLRFYRLDKKSYANMVADISARGDDQVVEKM